MPTDFEELKRKLLQTDEEFRQLATQHHDLDEKIHSLATRHYLSEPEQIEEVDAEEAQAPAEGSDGDDPARSTACPAAAAPAARELRRAHRAVGIFTGQQPGAAGRDGSCAGSWPFVVFCGHQPNENRSCRCPVHRRRAWCRPPGLRAATARLGGVVRARSVASSPISSAIRTAASPTTRARRVAGRRARHDCRRRRRTLGAARAMEAGHHLPVAASTSTSTARRWRDASRASTTARAASFRRTTRGVERQRVERNLGRCRRQHDRLPAGRRHPGAPDRLSRPTRESSWRGASASAS